MDPIGRAAAFATLPDALTDRLPGFDTIALYAGIGAEPDLLRHVAALHGSGFTVALPWSAGREAEPAFRFHAPGDPLVTGPFGTRQPDEAAPLATPDALLCPLVGFDRAGNRLGQGGGWYDRAIAAIVPRPLLIGVGWAVQEVDAVPTLPHDQPMDLIWTEEAVIATAPSAALGHRTNRTDDHA